MPQPNPIRELRDAGRLDQYIEDHNREHDGLNTTIRDLSKKVDWLFTTAVGTLIVAIVDLIVHKP